MRVVPRDATAALLFVFMFSAPAFSSDSSPMQVFGPWNGAFRSGGLGLEKPIRAGNPPTGSKAPFTMYCWFRADQTIRGRTFLAGLGNPEQPGSRYLLLTEGGLSFRANGVSTTSAGDIFQRGRWHFVAAVYDGSHMRLFADGKLAREAELALVNAPSTMVLAPPVASGMEGTSHFSGRIGNFTLVDRALNGDELRAIEGRSSMLDLVQYEPGSRAWPVQTRAMFGQKAPQDPATLPQSKAKFSLPVARSAYNGPDLAPSGENRWTLAGKWLLAAAPDIHATPQAISQPGFVGADSKQWLAATVPGTVLTTYIDRGVYPDPDYGLNNLAIPESMNQRDYWYRAEFTPVASSMGKRLKLTFHGINYRAEVWLNGSYLGEITGAFIRGTFDVTHLLRPGKSNALAVRISPPPHPGLAQEESMAAGPGENGGMQCLDGPTFVASEGWDWIPSIRDRNAGIWQDVVLSATGLVEAGDPQVTTTLPLPDTSTADIAIKARFRNTGTAAIRGKARVSFEGVSITKDVTLPPGEDEVSFTSSGFPALRIANPRLWWPNGYGKPELYHLRVDFTPDGAAEPSDRKEVRFGIREVTYELSLIDPEGQLQRVEYSPARAKGEQVIDIRHEGALQSAQGWVYSIRPGQAGSPTLRPDPDNRAAPFLILKVNGARISVKGGSWGMDDSRKRVSRERLEPFFRLHRDAHITMIRNWVGQSTEEAFFDLADEYGLLVWNDFWQSTQDYNLEPADSSLFLANARDTIARFTNHPSIVLWCGRNEGMPSVAVNEGLDALTRSLDGTRLYMPSSNQINLQNSGPYLHRDAADYFTTLSKGFAVEVGIPSVPTLESLQSFIPKEDRWPIGDTWAYHDWHQSGNGRVAPFMEAVERQFGTPESMEDFERKAQMINYVNHRAIFEGLNAHLFAPNSGRMLWMTQPAWPSTNWQILSHDYDTQASFYGTMKGCEPVHVQMNLPDLHAAVINNTAQALSAVTLRARVFSLDGRQVSSHEEKLDAAANAEMDSFAIGAPESFTSPVFIKLELTDATGALLSENFYWHASQADAYKQLNQLPAVEVRAAVTRMPGRDPARLDVTLTNTGSSIALMNKLTLVDAKTQDRILPAYYSDNYVSLLPNETRHLTIEAPATAVQESGLQVNLRGWNITAAAFPIQ